MKKYLVILMAAVMLIGISGCAKKNTEAEGDIVSTDYAQYAGTYTCSEDGSTVTLGKDGSVSVSIVRLCQLDGKADGIYKGIVKLNVTDPNGDAMKLEFMPESGELVAVESKWGYIKNGDSFKFDKKP